jgi:hypothetical protein
MGHAGSKARTRKVTVSPKEGMSCRCQIFGKYLNFFAHLGGIKELKPESEASFGEFAKLPHDLIVLVFSQLSASEILYLSTVSKGTITYFV